MTSSETREHAIADQLIYENANTYRLHADNLRWTLLGGYGALLIAAASVNTPPFLLLWVIAIAAFFVLAIQNWFYNLFACFVTECEERLVRGEPLGTLQAFVLKRAQHVSPFHPAFLFALMVVALSAGWFAARAIGDTNAGTLLGPNPNVAGAVMIGIHLAAFVVLGRFWNSIVYRKIICPMSNFWTARAYGGQPGTRADD